MSKIGETATAAQKRVGWVFFSIGEIFGASTIGEIFVNLDLDLQVLDLQVLDLDLQVLNLDLNLDLDLSGKFLDLDLQVLQRRRGPLVSLRSNN